MPMLTSNAALLKSLHVMRARLWGISQNFKQETFSAHDVDA